MSDLKALLERADRAVAHISLPTDGLEGLQRRRDRKRRNQRIAAGVVGIAVFVAAVWIVRDVASLNRTDKSVVPATSGVTGPAETAPTVAPDPAESFVHFLGATPSAPELGELVLGFGGEVDSHPQSPGETPIGAGTPVTTEFLRVWVFADGRLIWNRPASASYAEGLWAGLFEQRLTPQGVELVRSELRSIPDTGCDTPPLTANFGIRERGICQPLNRLDGLLTGEDSWLPASAWDDQVARVFVPAAYSVCFNAPQRYTPAEAFDLLPAQAEELLAEYRTPFGDGGGEFVYCSDVTNEEARALAEAFEHSEFERAPVSNAVGASGPLPWGGYTTLKFADETYHQISVSFEPILPHGEAVCAYCGGPA